MKRLLTICLVLLFSISALATPIGQSNVTTATTAIQADTDALEILSSDILAKLGIGTGNVFYVDSAAGGSGTGLSWTNAEVTLDAAIGDCAADNGDFIFVAPTHVETLTTADGVNIDLAGITIIGLGSGENRPTFTFTTNGEVVIGKDDVEIHNLNFVAGNAVTHAIDIEAGSENWVINNCRFWTTTVDTDEFTDCIDVAAGSDNGKLTNCQVEMGAASAVSFITNVGSDYVEIANNMISGDFSTAAIVDETTASIWLNIHDNTLVNGTVGGTAGLNTEPCIELKSDSSALVINNRLFCNVANEGLAVVAADGLVVGNTYVETEGSVLEVGKVYSISMSSVMTGATDQMFTVAGGAIEIISMFGQVTTNMGSNPGDLDIAIDATAGATYDGDFTTAVTIDAAVAGDVIKWGTTTAGESVLVPTTLTMASLTQISWFCPAGEIEQNITSTGTGAIKWYMTFRPLEPGVTVTAN